MPYFTINLAHKGQLMHFTSLLQLLPTLSSTFPTMRVRWGYIDRDIVGILDHIKTSLGDDLTTFRQTRKTFDPNNMFVNTFLQPLV